jgi:SAM-dependent methyltransferase
MEKTRSIASRLRTWLAEPDLRGLDEDDPRLTLLRRDLIRRRTFLRRIYAGWYDGLLRALPDGPGPALELGSGGGFLAERQADILSSDIFHLPHLDLVLDGQKLPFRTASLRGVLMVNVFHHLPDVKAFLAEAARCVRPGGVLAMLEPWVTPWSRLVYRHLHKEPFDPAAGEWAFCSSGPLSGANGALPWMVFARDRERFEAWFPEWQVTMISPGMPFLYLLSGGVSLRPLAPDWSWGFWRAVERLFPAQGWGMFAQITLLRTSTNRLGS